MSFTITKLVIVKFKNATFVINEFLMAKFVITRIRVEIDKMKLQSIIQMFVFTNLCKNKLL